MGFLSFTLHLIDFLAWPVLALGYPICASIRAIETGSEYHMRKLVTYWTIFSFISLFEHVFEKLIEWVPLWPYIKLIAICWLVIPEFNSACYFYQHLVHPCFPLKLHDVIAQFYGSCYVYQCFAYLCSFVNLQTFTDWFNKPMEDPSLKTETFLDVGERYLEENGSDPLVKLIANKLRVFRKQPLYSFGVRTAREGSGPVWEDIKVREHMAKHEAAEPKQVEGVKENQIHIEKETVGMQVEGMVVPADTEECKLPEITCTVCQLTTTSEHNLKSRRKRRRRKVTCEELKIEGSSPVTTKSNQLNQAQVKDAAAPQSEQNTNEAADPKQVKSVEENLVQVGKKTTGVPIKETTLLADNTKEITLRETNSLNNVQKEWTCALCQVTTNSEHDLKCHLLGRNHREKCEELKTCKKKAKAERNLKQEQVEHALAPQITRSSTNEKPKEKVQLGATGQYEKQKQVKNAVGVAHSSKLLCRFCNVKCLSEIDLAAHLKGRKHLAKLQETMV
ncbi:uncharacterized protein [Nicotiana sylvestris]|uniref:uncharacterized protein isoform X1 n=1 Tax=Nicotiana sylvestris TaxID=4096 RepID=UPI00388CBEE4